jgi:DNA replication and repair protein RecF
MRPSRRTDGRSRGASVHLARTDSLTQLQALIAAGPRRGEVSPPRHLALTPLLRAPRTSRTPRPRSKPTLIEALWRGSRNLDRAAGRTHGQARTASTSRCAYAQKGMPAALGSTGEQKALLIGLILAHARLVKRSAGIAPFLLLDEVAAHLDPGRRAALFAALDSLGTQCFMTGTDPMLFEALADAAQRVTVKDGRLAREP